MKSKVVIFLLIALNIALFGLFIFQYANADYPLVGHDFRLFLSRLLDSYLHYKVNGFSIQWYTPSFGGGLPAYANPLQAQFSLPQLLIGFIDPWNAVLISSVLYSLAGFLAIYFFLKDALETSPLVAILGGMFFIANGFFIERVIIGHINFISYPLIAVFIIALFDPKISTWIAGILLGLTCGILVYSGGVYIGVIGLFSVALTIPILYFLKPSLISLHRLFPIILLGGILTIFICGSKLNASSLFMANFPREVKDEYQVNWITGLGGLIFQLIGVMTTSPLLFLIGKSSMVYVARLGEWTGTPYSFWELDSSLSPVLLLLLSVGIWRIIRRKPLVNFSWGKFVSVIFLLFSILVVIQFSIAKGLFFETLRLLPVLKSLHANTRFTSSFVMPLAILGATVFADWGKSQKGHFRTFLAFLLLDGLVIISLWTYFLLPLEVQLRTCEIEIFISSHEKIKAGDTMPVNVIIPDMNDYEVFQAGASNTVRHYEPLFRDNNEAFHPEVQEGSVFEIRGGYFNMTNPTGYLFPEENGTYIYERFRVSDIAALQKFLNRYQPDWKISKFQRILDSTAFFCFIGILLFLLSSGLSKIIIKSVIKISDSQKKHSR